MLCLEIDLTPGLMFYDELLLMYQEFCRYTSFFKSMVLSSCFKSIDIHEYVNVLIFI